MAASSSRIAGLKFCVVARNSSMFTPSARSRCAICVDCQGSKPTLATRKRRLPDVALDPVEVGLVARRDRQVVFGRPARAARVAHLLASVDLSVVIWKAQPANANWLASRARAR